MSEILSEQELRDKVSQITDYFNGMGKAEPGQDGWFVVYDKKLDELLALIQSQKQAYADKKSIEERINEYEVLGEVNFEDVPLDIIHWVASRKSDLKAQLSLQEEQS